VPAAAGVAIVGAGAAGLAAAWTLARAGVGRVTVFDADDDVGGKVSSIDVGGATAELGQLALGLAYRRTLALADEVGLALETMSGRSFLRQGDELVHDDLRQATAAWARWRRAVLDETDDDDDREVGALASAQADGGSLPGVLWTGCGYGPLRASRVPSVYLRRYLLDIAVDEPITLRLVGGNQALWRLVRARLSDTTAFRVGTSVTSVRRQGDDVVLTLAGGEEQSFRRVVLAVPPRVAAMLIDDERRALLQRYRTFDYRSAVVVLPGLTARLMDVASRAGAAWSEQGRGRARRMVRLCTVDDARLRAPQVLWGFPQTNDAFVVYQYAEGADDGGVDEIATLARALGVEGAEIVAHRRWEYFPHLAAHDRCATERALAELDGRGGVWVTGAWRSFETVEHAVAEGERIARALLAVTSS
jgi:phytoene dehydrogenase-like protein